MAEKISEAKRFRASEEASRDNQKMRTSCAFCKWTMEGTAVECREQATAHRLVAHPEIQPINLRRTRKSALHTFRHPEMDDDHKADIETERQKRARLHGVEIED